MCGICRWAERLVCCCFACAWSHVISLLSGIIILQISIGVIVYFGVYHNKDNNADDAAQYKHQNLTSLIKPTPEINFHRQNKYHSKKNYAC